ncbi:MAG: Uma2 family endonuclease [Okeania sp. SIO3B3]|nr:Uma2 family endonuclease [Okeania sp. SIO3B3]
MTINNNPSNIKISLPDNTQLSESDGTFSTNPPNIKISLPDHTQLPESDGTFVKNFQEHPQSILLTDSIRPVLEKIHPDQQYCIGQDSGIYWRVTEPLERGAVSPDWFYVPNVPPTLNGKFRRSYVLWKEVVPPLIAIEFVSGDGSEERDKKPPIRGENGATKKPGKFWVYEKIVQPRFYAIYEVEKSKVEVYKLEGKKYELVKANERGHYPISDLGVELGIWSGSYQNVELPWLRWWDSEGNLLITNEEGRVEDRQKIEQERQRAEQESQRAEQERLRAEKLAEKLRAMGIDPEE